MKAGLGFCFVFLFLWGEFHYLMQLSDCACLETTVLVLLLSQVVADSEQYFKLTSRQVASMLAENSLRVNSEYRLFELVLRWIKNDREGRQPYVADLMNNVRLPLLSGEELVERVMTVLSNKPFIVSTCMGHVVCV